MSGLSLSGRVVRAPDLAPLANVPVRLVGPARAMTGLPHVQPLANEQQVTWTRQLTGFRGTRWECWTKEVQGKVTGITWEQFRDNVLIYNPQLNTDGRLFQPFKSYLLPETNTTRRAMITVASDGQGNYTFALGTQAAAYDIEVAFNGYARFVQPLVVNGHITQPIQLMPQSTTAVRSGSIRSASTDYLTLPDKARRVIDQALFMLGDDTQVYDALPPDLQQMIYGARFADDPNNFNYKDITCSDLISVAFKAAGLDINWPSKANPHMADYYHPDRGNPRLIEITAPNDWLPGDVLVYGTGARSSKAGHNNLYVGPFNGTDRSGKTYNLSESLDVVEASIAFTDKGRKIGTGVIGANLQRCLQAKRGMYTWVRHVRLRELAALFGRG